MDSEIFVEKKMKIITDPSGAKRTIYNYGLDLRAEPGRALVEGDFDLAGRRKAECWYIPATNNIESKTPAEINSEATEKETIRKQLAVAEKIVAMIIESKTFDELKSKVQTAIGAARKG